MKNSIQSLSKDTRAALNRLSNAEKCMGTLEENMESVFEQSKKTAVHMESALRRLDDLENRGCWNNLRLVGLKEGLEGGDINSMLEKILC